MDITNNNKYKIQLMYSPAETKSYSKNCYHRFTNLKDAIKLALTNNFSEVVVMVVIYDNETGEKVVAPCCNYIPLIKLWDYDEDKADL